MTPTELEQAARERYNAVGETFWSSAEMLNLMYAACLEIATETLCIERTYETSTVASQQDYAFPTNTIAIKRVTYNGSPIDPISLEEGDLITLNNTTQTTVGAPVGYAQWDETISLYPAPSEVQTLKIYTYNEPQELTTTSTLEVPTIAHTRLINYMLSEMYAKDKDFASAKYYKDIWINQDIPSIRQWIQKKKRRNRFAAVKDEESIPAAFTG